ncbi:MAG: family 20 glycosylhydrolase, partial [Alistipes sp.]|nr:family 20 glycosylhydrolase [Alistipes sp.]
MIRKFLTTVAAALTAIVSVSAYSGPSKLIPEPVDFTIGQGVYTLKPDGSDIKVYLNDASFATKVDGLPDFAKEEAYELVIGKKGVKIYALTKEGAFRGRQTVEMLRLLDQAETVQQCTIFDYPRFQHRGIMLDESRSFKGKEFVKKQIDALALLKMNVMHLHLTDAAGWRLQIDAYPNLTDHVA